MEQIVKPDALPCDGDGDVLAVARQRLIDGVVHDLVDEMVQTGRAGGANVHTGTLPNSLQTLQDLALLRAVLLGNFGFVRHYSPPDLRYEI